MSSTRAFSPRPSSGLSRTVLIAVVAIGIAGGVMWQLSTTTPGVREVLILLVGAAAGAAFCFWSILDDRRARSVIIDETSVSGLVWKHVMGFIPVGLARVELPWSNVRNVRKNGLVLCFEDAKHQLCVNMFLFVDPESLFEFVKEKTRK